MGRDEETSFYAPPRIGLMWWSFRQLLFVLSRSFILCFLSYTQYGFHNGWHQNQPPEVFYKKAGLENFAICTGKHLSRRFFLIKLQACNSSYSSFLWILRNFQEHLLWKTSTNDFRIFPAVKSNYSGEIFCGDIFWSILFILGNYHRVVFRTLSNI